MFWCILSNQSKNQISHCAPPAPAFSALSMRLVASRTLAWSDSKDVKYYLICSTGSSISIPVIFGALSCGTIMVTYSKMHWPTWSFKYGFFSLTDGRIFWVVAWYLCCGVIWAVLTYGWAGIYGMPGIDGWPGIGGWAGIGCGGCCILCCCGIPPWWPPWWPPCIPPCICCCPPWCMFGPLWYCLGPLWLFWWWGLGPPLCCLSCWIKPAFAASLCCMISISCWRIWVICGWVIRSFKWNPPVF